MRGGAIPEAPPPLVAAPRGVIPGAPPPRVTSLPRPASAAAPRAGKGGRAPIIPSFVAAAPAPSAAAAAPKARNGPRPISSAATATPAPFTAVAPPLPPAVVAALATLKAELLLSRDVIYRNQNQLRRAPYFRAFRQLHALAARAADELDRGGGASPRARRAVVAALAAALPLCRRVVQPHTGAGFAGLAVILAASAAVYWEALNALSRALDALPVVAAEPVR